MRDPTRPGPAGRKIATEQLLPARGDTAALFNDLSIEDRAEVLRLLGKIDTLLNQRRSAQAPGELSPQVFATMASNILGMA